MKKSKMKLIWKILIAILAVALCVAIALVSSVFIFRKTYFKEIPEKIDSPKNQDELYTVGRGIYDKDGNRVALKGINFGSWLIQEGWMTVNSLGAKYNSDGSYTKVNEDGIIEEYVETYQDEVEKALADNPNLTDEQVEELWNVYYDNYITEEDFKNVKEQGFNVIRLPMYYGNFMEGEDDALTLKENAFVRIDWFLEMCKKYDLYAILDMHGVVGGQSGYEHCGTRRIEFWDNEVYQQEMCDLWSAIAKHYKYDRPDLSATIAMYDLVNEPVDRNTASTTNAQHKVMKKLYDAIREVDDNHIISIESCWMYNTFPDPDKFGYENVCYQIHMYNWSSDTLPYELFYFGQDFLFAMKHYDVPYYIGEFTFFNNKDHWREWLAYYDDCGFNWTIWNYKTVSYGWWDTSWGLYVDKMNMFDGKLKLDLRTATYDEIYAEWSRLKTSDAYNNQGVLKEVLDEYFGK